MRGRTALGKIGGGVSVRGEGAGAKAEVYVMQQVGWVADLGGGGREGAW